MRKKKKLNKMQTVLIELDKGEYDNLTDVKKLGLEVMRDFKLSHTLAIYIATAFFHYKK